MKALLALLIALLHLALWGWLQLALRPPPGAAAPAVAAVTWLHLKAMPKPATVPRANPPGVTVARMPAPAARTLPAAPAQAVTAWTTPAPPVLAAAPEVAATAAPPESSPAPAAASAAAQAPRPSLLDAPGTRRAVAATAATPGLGELGRVASGQLAAASRQEQLANRIERTALGDCLKGEFAGAGMGVLSLPFFAWAEASGSCRR